MGKFKTAIRGYDKKEVDAYLHKTTEYNESKLRELEDHINRLKEENDYLYAKNGEYHRNEERVSGAILKAMQVKNELESELKKKIQLEEDRLMIFKSKWIAYFKGLHNPNADRVLEDVNDYVETFRRDFVKKANRELDLPEGELSQAERSYLAEQARVNEVKTDFSGEKMSAASLLRNAQSKSGKNDGKIEFFDD
ncbi:MAG: DivIVA domain-containing protein [Clostridia bacterium]|nr:DivIVA domain-containing protein [Clostridia bacterium]